MVIDPNTELGKRTLERLNDEIVIWLTTVDANDTPQPRPVWFLWQDESILIYSKPTSAKLKHIALHPNVALNFNGDQYGDDIQVIIGEAIVDDSAPAVDANTAYREKYNEHISGIGLTPESMGAAYSAAIRVKINKLRDIR
ncbi:MAG: TIGR03667 family PPOX class F420-dependent oxidoreductase [Anaerolineae bacterium]|nr:TIGR03667 family PPOX class F420-dependent oxidoreductase [Anaerolineae bacterium]